MSLLHKTQDKFSSIPPEHDAGTIPDTCYWRVGDVLKIGRIVTHKGEEVDSLVLEPQGIAHLISEEKISLPRDVCAFAHVLTRQCNKGLLTLNIGVIDPGWENHVGTAILNFSSERRLLEKGQEFIRLSYHKIDSDTPTADLDCLKNGSRNSYCQDTRARSVNEFGKHFLGIKRLVGKASEKETTRLRDALLKYIPIAAFSLAFFAMMVTIGVTFATRFVNRSVAPEASKSAAATSMEEASDNAEIRRRIAAIEKRLDQSQPLRLTNEMVPAIEKEKVQPEAQGGE